MNLKKILFGFAILGTALAGGLSTASAQVAQNATIENQNKNIVISAPMRTVADAANVATLTIPRENCRTNFTIPYIQTSRNLHVSADAKQIAQGQGVKFILTGAGKSIISYDFEANYAATIYDLPKAEYKLEVFIVDKDKNVIAGEANSDFATNIAIGDIIVAIGDSITEGFNGVILEDDPYKTWLDAGLKSRDNRNYPQCGSARPNKNKSTQQVSQHLKLNDSLAMGYGYPVFILNQGRSGITTTGYLEFMKTATWNKPNELLKPNKWIIHLGVNDRVGSDQARESLDNIVQTLINDNQAQPKDIYLSTPLIGQDWPTYIDKVIADNKISVGPDFNTLVKNYPEFMSDTVHPNEVGQEAMADMWATAMIPAKPTATTNTGRVLGITGIGFEITPFFWISLGVFTIGIAIFLIYVAYRKKLLIFI